MIPLEGSLIVAGQRKGSTLRVLHVTPATFGEDGIFGGGERYPYELARAMARHVPTKLLSFGAARRVFT